MSNRGGRTRCPECNSTNVEYFPRMTILAENEDGDMEEANHTCNDCDHSFYARPDRYNAIFCPECGSGATEPARGANRYWCDECGTTFTHTPKVRKPQKDRTEVLKEAFRTKAAALGIPIDWLGRTFTYQGTTYEVGGLNPRAPKMPIVLLECGGKRKMRCDSRWLSKQIGAPLATSPDDSRAAEAAVELRKRGQQMGIDPAYAGRIFRVAGKRVRLLGLLPRIQKMPVSYQVIEDGSYRKSTVEYFLRFIDTIEPQPAPVPAPALAAEPAEVPASKPAEVAASPAVANTSRVEETAQFNSAEPASPALLPSSQTNKSGAERSAKTSQQMQFEW